jgi:16S rRNA (cytosine1402-N4)-methyltransferase
VNSLHLDRAERGFSLKREGPLDMRMNPQETGAASAADLVNGWPEEELERIFRQYGEERFSYRIAQAIVMRRSTESFKTTRELQEVVAGAIPRRAWPPRLDPATRVFQALRIAVNGELDELDAVLAAFPGLLNPGGRAGIISFHSLEDRRVKEAFRELARGCICPPELPVCMCGRQPQYKLLGPRPITAGEKEIEENPRARSAKLRVIEKQEIPPSGERKDG